MVQQLKLYARLEFRAMGRLASDIGGTFTDLVYFDDETGALKVEKSLTTPKNLTKGVEDTIRLAQIDPNTVDFFVHGGTTVINASRNAKALKRRWLRQLDFATYSRSRAATVPIFII